MVSNTEFTTGEDDVEFESDVWSRFVSEVDVVDGSVAALLSGCTARGINSLFLCT